MKKDILNLINEIVSLGKEKGIGHLITEDAVYDGRIITVGGKQLVNFGSYSYLGLELDPRLKAGAIDAIQRYGIQYPSSRSYVSCTLYSELEALMKQIFNSPVVLATSTTLGHQAVIPIVMEEKDVVIMDQQAHASVQYPVLQTQQKGVRVTIVRHNHLEELEIKIKELSIKHKKIWYACDGVYSMYGDCAPVKELIDLLNRYPQLHLYVDDAHGISWAGTNGTGYVLSQVNLHPRMILAASLNKAFAAGGAAFAIPDADLCEKVRNCGGPLMFAGQHQTAALGAGIACAKIHLSPVIYTLQQELELKINYCQALLEMHNLPVVSDPHTPVFFIGLGLARVGYNLVKRMIEDHCFVNLAIFPAVPETCTGVRFTITRHHTMEDIENITLRLAHHFSRALKEEGRTVEDIQRAFRKVAHFKTMVVSNSASVTFPAPAYTTQHETSIQKIPKELWNNLLGDKGMFDWDGLHFLEDTFKNNPLPEHNWDFHYYIIRDSRQEPVLATFFTLVLSKDDLLAPAAVSQQLEQQRKHDPYYLTSKTLTMGSLLTEGQHLYINRSHEKWREALMLLLDQVWQMQEKTEINNIYLRDFFEDDIEISDFLMQQGFLKVKMPDTHIINDLNWNTAEQFFQRFKSKGRKYIKDDILKYKHFYKVEIVKNPTEKDIDKYYQLYKNVKNRSFELNTFDLPIKLFKKSLSNPSCEIMLLKLIPEYSTEEELMVSMTLSFLTVCNNYCGLIIGLDYNFVKSHNLYKQTLYQTILRANKLKANKLYLGLTASETKRKLGAKAIPQVAYVQIKDQYNVSLINTIMNQ